MVAAVQHLRDNRKLKAVEVCRRCNLNILGGQLLPSHFFVYTSGNIRQQTRQLCGVPASLKVDLRWPQSVI